MHLTRGSYSALTAGVTSSSPAFTFDGTFSNDQRPASTSTSPAGAVLVLLLMAVLIGGILLYSRQASAYDIKSALLRLKTGRPELERQVAAGEISRDKAFDIAVEALAGVMAEYSKYAASGWDVGFARTPARLTDFAETETRRAAAEIDFKIPDAVFMAARSKVQELIKLDDIRRTQASQSYAYGGRGPGIQFGDIGLTF